MTELEIMKNAEACLRYLIKGTDPFTKEAVPENDVVRKKQISKYLNFTADFLHKAIAQQQNAAPKNDSARFFRRGFDLFAHPSGGAEQDQPRHTSRPSFLIRARSVSLCPSSSSVRGRRSVFSVKPIAATAALTGIGLTSENSASIRAW